MISLGEMVSYLPLPGGHITMAERFVDPAWSFTLGWNYCAYNPASICARSATDLGRRLGYNWTIILPAELSAGAVLISFW